MPVAQDIQSFYKSALERDFARDFNFRVTQFQLQGVEPLFDDDLVYVKAADLPGIQNTNVEVPYMGLPFNVPGNATFPGSDSYKLTFYLDANSELRNFFERAARQLFDVNVSTGNYNTPGIGNFIELQQLDKANEPIPGGRYKLIGASFRNVGAVNYKIAEGKGSFVEIEVTVSYHFYNITG